jgi:polysaccharide export outer membrane protein
MLWIVLFVAASLGAAQAGNDVPGRARIQPLTPQNEQMGEQAGIQTGDATATPSAEFAAAPAAQAPQTPTGGTLPTTDYVLGIGDHIRLTVYGEDDLSGEYEVNSTGMMALPLIGAIKAAGTTLREFEEAVRVKLKAGYLNDPRVSVQVANYRPFFILGEVSKPGSYPYVNGMTVLNAVALAGGYTYRADDGGVTIVHATDAQKKEQRAREDDIVMPGDIVRVPERLF